jgi:hypothetical protein
MVPDGSQRSSGAAGFGGASNLIQGRSKVATPSRVLLNFDSSAILKILPLLRILLEIRRICIRWHLACHISVVDGLIEKLFPGFLDPGDD